MCKTNSFLRPRLRDHKKKFQQIMFVLWTTFCLRTTFTLTQQLITQLYTYKQNWNFQKWLWKPLKKPLQIKVLEFKARSCTHHLIKRKIRKNKKQYKYIKSFKKLLLQTKKNLNCILCIGFFKNSILIKIWLPKKQYQSYVFLLFQIIFFIIYHRNASASNETEAVFHFGLFINYFSSSMIPLIEPYNLMILCMLTNISPEFCCFGNAKESLMYTCERWSMSFFANNLKTRTAFIMLLNVEHTWFGKV